MKEIAVIDPGVKKERAAHCMYDPYRKQWEFFCLDSRLPSEEVLQALVAKHLPEVTFASVSRHGVNADCFYVECDAGFMRKRGVPARRDRLLRELEQLAFDRASQI